MKIVNRLLSILTAVLLSAIPLYPKFPAFDVPGTYVRIRLEDFLVTFTLLLVLIKAINSKKKFSPSKIGQAIFLYWAAGLLSLCSALLITKLVTPHIAILHFLRRIEYMGLFFVGLFAVRNKHDLKVFFSTLFISIFGVFVYGMGQKFFNFPVVSTMNEEFSKGFLLKLNIWTRISSTFGGHYDLAAFLSMILPLILTIFFLLKKKSLKIIFLSLFTCSYYLLILTASRISFFAYLIAIFFLLILLNKKLLIIPILVLSILGSFFSEDINQRFAATIKTDLPRLTDRLKAFLPQKTQVPLVLAPTTTPIPTPIPLSPTPAPISISKLDKKAITTTPPPASKSAEEIFWEKQQSVEMGVERSGGIRFDVEWPRAIRHFKKNPILGTGYSSITLATDNDYLRALGETGILGLLAFLLIFLEEANFIVKSLKSRQVEKWKKAIISALATSTLAMLANACFIDVFEASKVAFTFWLLLGIIVGSVKEVKS